MATATILPNAQPAQVWYFTPWASPYNLWSWVDELESEGTPGTDHLQIGGSPIGTTPITQILGFEAYSTTGLSEDIDQVTVHVYAGSINSNAAARLAIICSLSNNEGEQELFDADVANQWYSKTFTPSGNNWTSSDIDGMTVSYKATQSTGYGDITMHSTYAELRESAATGLEMEIAMHHYTKNLGA